jgi:aminocarboxymuconate-semialdehyde decarboxylase
VDRCIKQLGFRGIQIFSNIRNRPLDSPKFRPVFRHIAMLGAPIHLHPAIPLSRIGLDSPSLYLPLGFPYDTSLNALRLIQSGLFDEAPHLKLIVAHGGGVLPYLKGRIATYNAGLAPTAADRFPLANPIDDYLGKLYADSVCYHLEALECCYKVMGANRILYGTDHAFGRYSAPAELVDQLNCPPSERELIYHGNARRLLNIA